MPPVVILCLGIAAGSLLSAKQLIHYFQLESYQFPGYFRTIRRNLIKSVAPGLLVALSGIFLFLLLNSFIQSVAFIAGLLSLFLLAAGFLTGNLFYDKNAKKALVYTSRIKRLYAVSFLVLFFTSFIISIIAGYPVPIHDHSQWIHILLLASPVFLPLWIAISGLIAWPIEKAISELYFRDAQRILKSRNDLIRIGITGSWGKTSVKFILGTLLEEKYHTLVTPASFNTPMGVTKVIRTMLEPGHRIFVAEMGARHVGDIREMCRLVHPQYGVLTSVGPQHLETFKTIDRIKKTKYELIDAIPSDGCSFFSDDEGICRELFDITRKSKMISGMDKGKCDVWAEDVSVSENGSTFFLCTNDLRIPCSTVLLGELNIRNILLCACVCLKLGLSAQQISQGISKITPVEHRLQLLPNAGGITVIDDAFNSNILGARQAFSVLKNMHGKRILVTPGMVELGAKEEEMNLAFGKSAADCCDIVILVGKKRSQPILKGLKEGGFNPEKIYVVSGLDEATSLLRTIAMRGDTILFENDLPDNYTE